MMLVLALMFVCLAVTAEAQAPLSGKLFTLENGLTVFIKEMKTAPVVAVNIWVRVGSRHEKPGEEGFTHLIEHMMFKGTPTYPTGQLDKEIKKLGASQNAFTSSDCTCFHVTGAREHFTRLMELQADAVLNSTFDPAEFQKERNVVVEELRMDKDQPEDRLYNMTKETAYTVHPYKHPIVGYDTTLASATRDALHGYYKRWYVPSNMWVVIVGDIDTTEAIAVVNRTMGTAPAVAAPDQTVASEPLQNARRERREEGDIQQSYVNLAWHAPSIDNPDNFICDVISVMVGGGRSSRLFRALVEEERLVTDVSASYYTTKDPSLFIVSGQMPQGSIRKFGERVVDLLKQFVAGEIQREELEKAKQQLIATTVFSRETAESQAFTYGQFGILGRLGEADAYIDRIRSVTIEDVKRVARGLFDEARMSVVSYEPRIASGPQKPEMVTLENGIRLILRENHASPLVAVSIHADAGGLREGRNEAGLANLTAEMLMKGTEQHKADEIARTFESMGTSISCSAAKSFASIDMQCLSEKFDPSFDLLMEILTSPSFPEEEFETEQSKALEQIKEQDDDLYYFTSRNVLETLFPGHPIGYSNLGIADQVQNLRRSDVKRFFGENYVGSGMVVAVVGDIFVRDVKDRLMSRLSEIDKGSQSELRVPKFDPITEPATVTARLNREQAQIMVATRTFPRNDPRGPAMDVLKNILSGSMSSRLFSSLRDKDSLAYSVFAANVGTRVAGYFFATLSTAVERTETARVRLIEELEKIRTEGFSDEELNDAKQYIIGQHALELVNNQAQADVFASDEMLGLGFEYHAKYPDLIRAVTRQEVNGIMQEFLLGSGSYVLGLTTP
ncbi:MAG TPA: pitrilysin family protein [Candidatus Ozemobacteraceae bacterium]|nr:pitrilysin family protein [Candidatus Ozemobacteraceae bacterium]